MGLALLGLAINVQEPTKVVSYHQQGDMVEKGAHGCAYYAQVRAKDDHGAMHFARDILVRAAKTDVDYQELQDALSLMGYDDPAASPCGQMMSQHVSTCSPILTHQSSLISIQECSEP